MQKLLYLSLSIFLATAGLSGAYAFSGGGGGGGGSGGGGGGGSSGGGNGGSASNKPELHCKNGEVVKKVKHLSAYTEKCVKVESGILPDDELYRQGRALAKSGKYDWALQVLAAVQNQNDPRVLNMTGYSNRKAGRFEIGIAYYQKALAVDPNFVLAREYLGEGYVTVGKIDLAQIQLSEIKNRAGVDSEEYKDLLKAITTGVVEAD